MFSFSTSNLVQIYLAHSVAFSLCMALFIRTELNRHIILWILANFCGVIGFYALSARQDVVAFHELFFTDASLLFGGMIRTFVLMMPYNIFAARRRVVVLLALSAATYLLVLLPFLREFRFLAISIAGGLVTISAGMALLRNRLWRGTVGKNAILVVLAASCIGFVWQISQAYPIGPYKSFIGQSDQQYRALVALLVFSFFLQVAFFLMVSERLARSGQFAKRRASRATERASQLAERSRMIENLANDRLRMLNILTHEVRQPLNNAQAALQSVIAKTASAEFHPSNLAETVSRVQFILDDITLAISNAIIGALVVERNRESNVHECDVLPIAELARTDCPSAQRNRISLSADEATIFLAVDPILLRLALRNLMHNAMKFSPPTSVINVAVKVDDERFGVSFLVTNQLASPGRVSGEQREDGRLGLFVVHEISRVHNGTLRVIQPDDSSVTFELFVPK